MQQQKQKKTPQTRFPLWTKEMEAGNCCRGDVEHIRSLGNRPSCTRARATPMCLAFCPSTSFMCVCVCMCGRMGFLAPDQANANDNNVSAKHLRDFGESNLIFNLILNLLI